MTMSYFVVGAFVDTKVCWVVKPAGLSLKREVIFCLNPTKESRNCLPSRIWTQTCGYSGIVGRDGPYGLFHNPRPGHHEGGSGIYSSKSCNH